MDNLAQTMESDRKRVCILADASAMRYQDRTIPKKNL